MKKALITGALGQDAVYLACFLLARGYEVHGLKRPSTVMSPEKQSYLQQARADAQPGRFVLHDADMTEEAGLVRIVERVQPDEIYNLAAQSQVKLSFDQPGYTADVGALGTLRLLEAVRSVGLGSSVRFYQASSAEMFGAAEECPQHELTPFRPRSPYAISKLYAHWTTINYREAYGMFACSGILFNHESPLRGEHFVSRKITRSLARIKAGLQEQLHVGNLAASRDWGHARDYVETMWLMLEQPVAKDYVIATGERHSVRDFVDTAAAMLQMPLSWRGAGLDEHAVDERGRTIVRVDPALFRPTEVAVTIGDASRAQKELGWRPRTSFAELVREMAEFDYELAMQQKALTGQTLS